MLPFTFWPGALMMMSSSMVMMLLPKSAFVWAVPSKVVRSAWNSSSVSTSRMPAAVGNSETAPALLSLPMLSLGMPTMTSSVPSPVTSAARTNAPNLSPASRLPSTPVEP